MKYVYDSTAKKYKVATVAGFTDDLIQSHEILYFAKMKTGTLVDKWALIDTFDSIDQTGEALTKAIQFYHEKNERSFVRGYNKNFDFAGYLSRSEQNQEFINIFDHALTSEAETVYDVAKVYLYKEVDGEVDTYIADQYKAKAIVQHASPEDSFLRYTISFAAQGERIETAFKTADPAAPVAPIAE